MKLKFRKEMTLNEAITQVSEMIANGEIKDFEGFKRIIIWGNGTTTIEV